MARTVVCLFSSEYGHKYLRENRKYRGGGFEKTNHCHGISIAVMNITTKINFRKEGFISSDSYSPSSRNIRAGNQGRNPGAGTDAEAMKE